jgi:integrase/recombinase XerD
VEVNKMPCNAMKEDAPTTLFSGLRDAHLEYLALKHYSEATLRVRRFRIDMFVNWCTRHSISQPAELTRPVVEQYQAYLFHHHKKNGEPLSPSTQRSRLTSLGVWLKWMARQNIIQYNPVAELELPRPRYNLPQFLSSEEAEAILHNVPVASPAGLRDRAILETLYSTGIRRCELLKLKIHDLDMHRGVIAIRGGKGNRDRMVPIGDRSLTWIREYLSRVRPLFATDGSDATVFLTTYGRPFTPNHLSALVREHVRAAAIPKHGACHLFRHTMATLMLEGGADIRFIQQMLGHAKLDTTQIYTHVSIPVLKIVHSQTHPASCPATKKRRDRANIFARLRNFAVADLNTGSTETARTP